MLLIYFIVLWQSVGNIIDKTVQIKKARAYLKCHTDHPIGKSVSELNDIHL